MAGNSPNSPPEVVIKFIAWESPAEASDRTVQVSIEPTGDRDFEHLRNGEYRWMRLYCIETGARSNQLISHDISLESVTYYARKLAAARREERTDG